jgi:hypothetical protein
MVPSCSVKLDEWRASTIVAGLGLGGAALVVPDHVLDALAFQVVAQLDHCQDGLGRVPGRQPSTSPVWSLARA